MVSPVSSEGSTANLSCLLDQNTTPSSTTSGLEQTSSTPAFSSSLSSSHSYLYQLQQEKIRSLQEQLNMERQKRFLMERLVNGCDDHSISGGDGAGFHPIDISCVSSERSNNNKQNAERLYPVDLLPIENELFRPNSNGIYNDRNSEDGGDKNDDANSLGNNSRQSMQMSLMMESIEDISLNDSAACSLKHCDSQTTMGSIDEIVTGNMVNGFSTAMSAVSLMSMNDSTDSFFGLTSKLGGFDKGSCQNASWKDVNLTTCGGPAINTSRFAAIAGIDLKPLRRYGVSNPAA